MEIYKCKPHGTEFDPKNIENKCCGECLLDYLKWMKSLTKEERAKEIKEMLKDNK
jgi:hypothetical protein